MCAYGSSCLYRLSLIHICCKSRACRQYLKTVVFQNDPDDVLADVVYIALDGGKDDASLAGAALDVYKRQALSKANKILPFSKI